MVSKWSKGSADIRLAVYFAVRAVGIKSKWRGVVAVDTGAADTKDVGLVNR